MRMGKDFAELLCAFNAHKVKYILVGGYAFGLYTEPRATKDLDIFIRADKENSEAVFAALATFGAPLSGFSSKDFQDGSTYQIGQPPWRIDILQKIEAVTFDEAWEARVQTLVNGDIPVPVISYDLLIRNKTAVARPQDLLDVDVLREAARHRKEPQKP